MRPAASSSPSGGAYPEIDCRHRLVKSFVYEGKPEDERLPWQSVHSSAADMS